MVVQSASIPLNGAFLQGELTIPASPRGIVVFVHGGGSRRLSPRDRYVASMLHGRSLATLLFYLLTEREDVLDLQSGTYRSDIDLLSDRLGAAVYWIRHHPELRSLRIGLFGASAGAAAALATAAVYSDVIAAVVSRGGRPDLAASALRRVRAPTLLIVGGNDLEVLALNQRTLRDLTGIGRLEVIRAATHLFEEAGALERVAHLAGDWFGHHLAGQPGLEHQSLDHRYSTA